MDGAQLAPPVPFWAEMSFGQRLLAVRKARALSQQALADRVGLHVTLIRRYEAGKTQPSLDALRRIALALNVSADMLLFDDGERGPDDDLRLEFEAMARLDPDERKIVKALIESVVVTHDVRRVGLSPAVSGAAMGSEGNSCRRLLSDGRWHPPGSPSVSTACQGRRSVPI